MKSYPPVCIHPRLVRPLGAHLSTAGGLDLAVARMGEIGARALQIFSRNQRQWQAPELAPEQVARFREAMALAGNPPTAVHDIYLSNLASPEETTFQASVQALAGEISRTARLGIGYLITHPGAHRGLGVEAGITRYVLGLDQALARALDRAPGVTILLETTAGQGSCLGSRFEELGRIIAHSAHASRLGVCLDTAHAFAAGYELRTSEGYQATMDELDQTVGLNRLKFIHLNDSKGDLGSRLDRHEHIGQGRLGLDAFRLLLADPRLQDIPMVLETPKDRYPDDDIRNLSRLARINEENRQEPGQ